MHKERSLVQMRTAKELHDFVKFIFNNFKGVSLINILKGLQVPSLAELKPIIDSHQQQIHKIEKLNQQILDDLEKFVYSLYQ
jgi:hypothetical protein